MDPIKMEKAKGMERYKKIQFLQILFQYLLTALVLAMAISKAFPPSLFSSMKLFFFVSLPNIGAFIVSPKCIFIVCNAIVIFLFSESKLAGTSSQEIYDEYLRHQQNLRRQSSVEAKEKEKRLDQVCSGEGDDKTIEEGDEKVVKGLEEEKRGEEKEEEQQRPQEEDEDKKEKEDKQLEEAEQTAAEEEKEEAGMAPDELKRRADDFIARITEQFRLERFACGG